MLLVISLTQGHEGDLLGNGLAVSTGIWICLRKSITVTDLLPPRHRTPPPLSFSFFLMIKFCIISFIFAFLLWFVVRWSLSVRGFRAACKWMPLSLCTFSAETKKRKEKKKDATGRILFALRTTKFPPSVTVKLETGTEHDKFDQSCYLRLGPREQIIFTHGAFNTWVPPKQIWKLSCSGELTGLQAAFTLGQTDWRFGVGSVNIHKCENTYRQKEQVKRAVMSGDEEFCLGWSIHRIIRGHNSVWSLHVLHVGFRPGLRLGTHRQRRVCLVA